MKNKYSYLKVKNVIGLKSKLDAVPANLWLRWRQIIHSKILYTLKFHINKITLVISIIEKKQEALKRHILLQNQ